MLSTVGAYVPVTSFLFTGYIFLNGTSVLLSGFEKLNVKFIHDTKQESFKFTQNWQIVLVNSSVMKTELNRFIGFICVIIDGFISVFIFY